MQARVKARVEGLLHNICESLRRSPSAEEILGSDNYKYSAEKVRQRLTYLTPEEHKVVMMSRRGYSQKEIAVQMNISVESVTAHLHQGYLTLKTSASEPKQE